MARCIVSIDGQTLDAQLEQLRGTGRPRATEADRLSDGLLQGLEGTGIEPSVPLSRIGPLRTLAPHLHHTTACIGRDAALPRSAPAVEPCLWGR